MTVGARADGGGWEGERRAARRGEYEFRGCDGLNSLAAE